MNFIENPISIGAHNEWELFYRPATDDFLAKKGRKERTADFRPHLIGILDNEDATEARKKAREEPCTFRLWDNEKQVERTVEVSSLTSKGLALRPVAGGDLFYLPVAGYGGWSSEPAVPVIKNLTDSKRLHVAVEMLRRAQEELKAARKEIVTVVKVTRITGDKIADYFAEEDRLRKTINELNQ